MTKKQIAIIGAGPSGCSVLHAFRNHQDQFEFTVFDKQSQMGGLWNFNPETHIGKNGEPVHNGMYRQLWSNGPKECLEFPDFTFEDCYGKELPSYPPRAVVYNYLRTRYERDMKDLMDESIKFETVVRNVTFSDETQKFSLNYVDLKEGTADNRTIIEQKDHYDYVFVCSGHYSDPNMITINNQNNFKGQILHAHNFRNGADYKDKTIITIGSSYSAEDIASQCYKLGAKMCYLAAREKPADSTWANYKWPKDRMLATGMISDFDKDGSTVYFETSDRYPKVSAENVDAVILCTGYKHNYQFVDQSLRLESEESLYPPNLYKGLFWNDNPKMVYMGTQSQWYTFTFFECQALFAREVLLGNIPLPTSKSERSENIDHWLDKMDNHIYKQGKSAEVQGIYFQADQMEDYLVDVKKHSNVSYFENIKDISEVHGDNFYDFKNIKIENIMTFRDKTHFEKRGKRTMAYLVDKENGEKITWVDNMDDSIDGYLAMTRKD